MVPLMSRASLEGDVGHNACMSVYLCRRLCLHVYTRMHEDPQTWYEDGAETRRMQV